MFPSFLAALVLHAAPPPVVMVLPFENNTGNTEMDVLRRGFADMMSTDLTITGGVKVVERERLATLMGELKLQATDAFDPATVQKAGKMLGATHAITGHFLTVEPDIRVDVVMLEVGTGVHVVGATVRGEKARLFELQAQLTQRFLAALQRQGDRPAELDKGRWTRAPSLDATMKFSRALVALDEGRLDEAQQGFQELTRKNPGFALARVRLEDARKKLDASRAKGETLRLAQEDSLYDHAVAWVAAHDVRTAPEPDARTSLGYHWVRACVVARRLKRALSPGHPQLLMPDNRAAALTLAREYAATLQRYADDVDAFEARDPGVPVGEAHDTHFPLAATDARTAEDLKLERPPWPEQALLSRMNFVLLGQSWMMDAAAQLTMAPTLAALDVATEKAELQRASQLLARLETRAEKFHRQEFQLAQATQALGDFHDAMDRTDDALATWQGYLDRHPNGGMADQLEKRIREASGLSRNNTRANRARYAQGIATCQDMDVRVGISETLNQVAFRQGLDAGPVVALQLAEHCAGPKQQGTLAYGYEVVALWAASHRACGMFEHYLKEYLAHGGSAHDEPGIRKNLAPLCLPVPAP